MCGLFGFISNDDKLRNFGKTYSFYRDGDMIDLLWSGLVTSAPRGVHGTGIATIKHNGETEIYKRAVNPMDFVQLAKPATMVTYANLNELHGVMGHVRKATVGDQIDEYTHPHHVGDIILTHNGTIDDHNQLDWSNPLYKSDSVALAAAMNSIGVIETFEKARGGYACVWYNTKTKKFYMIRNDARPLHFAYVDDPKIMVYASEEQHLRWLMTRTGLKIRDDKIYHPKEHTLITINPEDCHDIKGTKVKPPAKKTIGFVPTGGQSTTTYKHTDLKPSDKKDKYNEMQCQLAGMGFSIGERVKFYGYEFDPYKKSTDGTLVGNAEGVNFEMVKAYGVDGRIAKDKKGVYEGLFIATVIGCNWKDKYPHIIVKDVERYIAELDDPEDDLDAADQADYDAYISGPDGNLITLNEFREIAKKKCSVCKGIIVPEQDLLQSAWLHKSFISGTTGLICPSCCEQLTASGDEQNALSHYCLTN